MKGRPGIHIIFIFYGLMLSCKEDDSLVDRQPEIDNVFQITIARERGDCSLPVIDFDEADKLRVEEITETTSWLRYYAFNLSKDYVQVGRTLKVRVRKTKPEEMFPCTTYGPGYQCVTVLREEE